MPVTDGGKGRTRAGTPSEKLLSTEYRTVEVRFSRADHMMVTPSSRMFCRYGRCTSVAAGSCGRKRANPQMTRGSAGPGSFRENWRSGSLRKEGSAEALRDDRGSARCCKHEGAIPTREPKQAVFGVF